ncbi:hypothetical protein [Pseudomonas sp. LFM046]|uniref:hypothetical protein n=1 Tax=Pseudomonas sp. LFM046 TaxID=1608357 RepID=UPI0011AF37CF|nr:hypothetical protein [Pseudomonas sp. LFM046]
MNANTLDATTRFLLKKYSPDDVRLATTAGIPRIQLVMSVDDYSERMISKLCAEFNKTHPEWMADSFTLLTDYTLPTGHILKAGSWVFRNYDKGTFKE